MRTALLAWELGGGAGHVVALGRIARRLMAHGFVCIGVLKDVARSAPLRDLGIEVLPAPMWPGPVARNGTASRGPSSASMGDRLASAGLADREVVQHVLGQWLALFAKIDPALIVGDYAPGAALAARGRVPLVLRGTGYSLPPAQLERFPLLHYVSPLVWDEEDVVAEINAALAGLGGPPIERLPQVFAAEASVVTTLPCLDPYRAQRRKPADGPIMDGLPDRPSPGADGIFVYLSPGMEPPGHVLEALLRHAKRLRLYAPTLARPERQKFIANGAHVFEIAPPPERELANNRCIIHYGVTGMAAAALLAGLPQLALSLDIEKDLVGQALEEMGVGRLVKIHDPAMRVTAEMIEEVVSEPALAAHAAEVASELRPSFNPDPLARFIAECARLAG